MVSATSLTDHGQLLQTSSAAMVRYRKLAALTMVSYSSADYGQLLQTGSMHGQILQTSSADYGQLP